MFANIKEEELPEGALTRYIRDIWNPLKGDFESFKKKWHEDFSARCAKIEKDNPIEFSKTFVFRHLNVRLLKRKGMDEWGCFFDEGAHGDYGTISLEEALKKISDKGVEVSLSDTNSEHEYVRCS